MSKATMKSPLELLVGYQTRTRGSNKLISLLDVDTELVDLEAVRENAKRILDKSQNYNKSKFDEKRTRATKLKVGDITLISQEGRRNKKLSKRFKGPYKVVNVLPNDRYELENVEFPRRKKPVMAFESLKLWPSQDHLEELMADE